MNTNGLLEDHNQSAIVQEFRNLAEAMRQHYSLPHVTMRPTLTIDGDHWCALYGANLHEGVAGFGKSPYLAMIAFDEAWWKELK